MNYEFITLVILGYMIVMLVLAWHRAVIKKETKESFLEWLNPLKKRDQKPEGDYLSFEELPASSTIVASTKLTFMQEVMKRWNEWWAERKRKKSQKMKDEADWIRINLEDQQRIDEMKAKEKAYKEGREKGPGWFVKSWRALKGFFYNPPLTLEEERAREQKRQARKARLEKEGGYFWWFINWIKTSFSNFFRRGANTPPPTPQGRQTVNGNGNTAEEEEHKDIQERPFLYWFLNILPVALIWIVIIALWIWYPLIIYGPTSDEGTKEKIMNLWKVLFVAWPIIAYLISAQTLKAHETGGAYGLKLFGGEMPLRNNLKPNGFYFAFPGFVSLSLDSLANRNYEIKGISDAELKAELERTGTRFDDNNIEALLTSWARKGIYRFREITTATPKLAEPHWPSFPYPKVVDPNGTIREMNDYEKHAVRERIKEDINNKQITLSPSMQIIAMINDYFHYKKNVEGNTPEERRIETGVQLTNIARSMANTELKKYTYSGLIYLQTSPVLDQKLEKEIGKLLKGYGEGPKASMGLQAIDARITSLGAPKEVHAAVNAVVTEGFNVQKKELDGEGNKLKAMEEAKGESFRQTQLGIGKARTLALLFAKAVEYEVDPTRLAAIQAQVTAFEFGKHTYFSDGSGTMGMDNNQAYAKFAAVLADAINAAMLQKGGKS